MITGILYIAMKYFLKDDWSGWALVLPVLIDLVIIEIADKIFFKIH